MVAFTMDGRSLAFQGRQSIKEALLSWLQEGYRTPGLAVIQVGQDAASAIYVKHKCHACTVVGASNIVGKPMALELLLAGTTVTICHRATTDLRRHVKMADIVIVATGVQDVVQPDWLHDKQVIIDVGIHRLEGGVIRGDVNFNQARKMVAWITPVPGGIGPMTIDSLLQNTLLAATCLDRQK